MPVQMLDAVNFNGIPSLLFTLPTYATEPVFSVLDEGQFIYVSGSNTVKFNDGTRWVSLGESGAGGPPSGAAGGDLAGSYPNPQIATGVIVDADINNSANIAQSKIAGLTGALIGKLDTAGGTLTGPLTLAGDPTQPLQAATKQYVDLLGQGFIIKDACKAVSTSNITLSGTQTVDGVALSADDWVLVVGQTDARQNGLYIVKAGAWVRGWDNDDVWEIRDGTLVPIAEGTANADSLWVCTATGDDPWVPNVSTSTWTKFLTLTDLQAGDGLTKTGTTIDFVAGNDSLTVNPDSVTVAHAPMWSTPRSLTLQGDVSGTTLIDGSGDVTLTATIEAGAGSHSADVGAGTSVVVTHNLGTRDVNVTVYRNSSPWDTVLTGVERTTVNTITLKFASAVTSGQYRCVVTG